MRITIARVANSRPAIIILPERAIVSQHPRPTTPPSPKPPPPVEKDRGYGGPYLKPPQQERQVRSSPDLRRDAEEHKIRPNRKQALMMQLASIKHWFLDSAKRATSPHSKTRTTHHPLHKTHPNINKSHLYHHYSQSSIGSRSSQSRVRRDSRVNNTGYMAQGHHTPTPKRNSLSPQPHTPHSSYRRSSSGRGLQGRNSTSSSVSSVRSFHHKTHSKASSTSSASVHSITLKSPRSPRSSIKMLPATPTLYQSNTRARGGYNESAVLASPVAFARRKRSVFKGPLSSGKRDSMNSTSSRQRGGGGGIIEEEEEEEDDGYVEDGMDFGLELLTDDDGMAVDDEHDRYDRRPASH